MAEATELSLLIGVGVVGAVQQVVYAYAVVIGQLYEYLGGEGDYPRFVLGIGVLRNIEHLRDILLFYIAVFAYGAEIVIFHIFITHVYYALSVKKILTYICNTDIMISKDLVEKRRNYYEILSQLRHRQCR